MFRRGTWQPSSAVAFSGYLINSCWDVGGGMLLNLVICGFRLDAIHVLIPFRMYDHSTAIPLWVTDG